MNDLIKVNFNNIADNGKVLSPLPNRFPDIELPPEILNYVQDEITKIDGESALARRWDYDAIADKDENSYQSIYYAASTKGKIARLLIDYKNMLSYDNGMGKKNSEQWKNATLLKSASDINNILENQICKALDELEDQSFLKDETNNALIQTSINAAYINESITKSLLDFMERHPDTDYNNGDKKSHFLFDNPLTKGGQYHLADIRHGDIEDQCMLVVDGAKIANQYRASTGVLIQSGAHNQVALVQKNNFVDLVKRAVLGSPHHQIDDPAP